MLLVQVINVGKFLGIPIRINLSWVIIAGLVTWSLVGGYFPKEFPSWSKPAYWSVGLITSVLFFASVLLHEVGHSVVAMREGVVVKNITLFILGGYIEIDGEPSNAPAEFKIAVAGPLASFALAGFFYLLALSTASLPEISGAARYLSVINAMLAVFNLIPGFPLDGGRVLRALIWGLKGNYWEATDRAIFAGQGIALAFICLGGGMIFVGKFIIGVWIAIIGWFLYTSAQNNYREASLAEVESQAAVRDFHKKS